ncbi:MAG: hypothetical protein H0Z18_06420 [Thermococcus sp.]|uniref:hypothetical protein n=1 Tax=Thermococcus sp. TaxID=35749 RepID=UPI001DE59B6A|nr:hypothetical protein [Thermococcus sp.]MBO8174877.1 hypothetical protein [Thermococcus sp.]
MGFRMKFVLPEAFKDWIVEILEDISETENPTNIINEALREYDVIISHNEEELFNATVYFNEFLNDLAGSMLYALGKTEEAKSILGEWIFMNLDNFMGCNRDLKPWRQKEVGELKFLLGEKFSALTSRPFLKLSFGSYDPSLRIFILNEKENIYFVNLDYERVAMIPREEFMEVVFDTLKAGISELKRHKTIFEEHGIWEYTNIIMAYEKTVETIEEFLREIHRMR